MFRSESHRERTLLRLVESQAQQIRDLTDRLMYVQGNVWTPPPSPEYTRVPIIEERTWTANPEQAPIYG